MLQKEAQRLRFGVVQKLKDGDQFLAAVESEDASVCVLVLLYEPGAPGCSSAVRAVESLARDHVHVKFCTARPSHLSMSTQFMNSGVPALLAYRGGQHVGNWVRFTSELGEDFESADFEGYLVEHGILNDRQLIPPSSISGPSASQNSSDED